MFFIFFLQFGVFGDRQGVHSPIVDVQNGIFIAIKSSPHNVQRRITLRTNGCTQSYKDFNIKYSFVVESASFSQAQHESPYTRAD